MLRLYSNIDEYKVKIKANDDIDKTKDIPFGTLYQQLLKKNHNEEIISLLLHVDSISVTKSSKLKMWMLTLKKNPQNNQCLPLFFLVVNPRRVYSHGINPRRGSLTLGFIIGRVD